MDPTKEIFDSKVDDDFFKLHQGLDQRSLKLKTLVEGYQKDLNIKIQELISEDGNIVNQLEVIKEKIYSDCAEIVKENDNLKAELNKCIGGDGNVSEKLQSTNENFKTLRIELKILKKVYCSSLTKLELIASEKDKLAAKCESAEKERNDFEAKLKIVLKENNELKSKCSFLTQEKNYLKSKLGDLTVEVNALKLKLVDLEEKRAKMLNYLMHDALTNENSISKSLLNSANEKSTSNGVEKMANNPEENFLQKNYYPRGSIPPTITNMGRNPLQTAVSQIGQQPISQYPLQVMPPSFSNPVQSVLINQFQPLAYQQARPFSLSQTSIYPAAPPRPVVFNNHGWAISCNSPQTSSNGLYQPYGLPPYNQPIQPAHQIPQPVTLSEKEKISNPIIDPKTGKIILDGMKDEDGLLPAPQPEKIKTSISSRDSSNENIIVDGTKYEDSSHPAPKEDTHSPDRLLPAPSPAKSKHEKRESKGKEIIRKWKEMKKQRSVVNTEKEEQQDISFLLPSQLEPLIEPLNLLNIEENKDMLQSASSATIVDKETICNAPETLSVSAMHNDVPSTDALNKFLSDSPTKSEEMENVDDKNRLTPKLIYKDDQWSPLNPEGKKKYDRDFLLQLQTHPFSLIKPLNLPNLNIIKDKAHTQKLNNINKHSEMPPWLQNFLPSYRSPQRKMSEQEKEDLRCIVQGILNQLSNQNFKTLLSQFSNLIIDTEEKLKIVVDLIFENAVKEQNFNVPYAKLCSYLGLPKVLTENGKYVKFRQLVLEKCHDDFERDSKGDTSKSKDTLESFEDVTCEKKNELFEEERKISCRNLGNIRFIGELFKVSVGSESAIHGYIKRLLNKGDEESFVILCELLKTVGKELEGREVKGVKEKMMIYFAEMQNNVDKCLTSSRVRVMLQDMIDLKKNNWMPKREENNPKTSYPTCGEDDRETEEQQPVLQNKCFNERIPDEQKE